MKTLGLLAAAITLMIGTGSASAMVYDFAGSNQNSGQGFTFGCAAGGVQNTGCSVTFNAAGVGVNGFSALPDTTPGQIDSFPGSSFETLVVNFAPGFTLNSFTLGLFNTLIDDYEYQVNGEAFSASSSVNPRPINRLVSSLSIKASSFSTLAERLGLGDFFTLRSFEGSFAAVPLPAGLPLLVAGLGGLGLLGWRKKKSLKQSAVAA